MNMDKFVAWCEAAAVRALKTFAQAAIAAMPTTAVTLGEVSWGIVFSTAAVAAVISILTSVAGLPEVKQAEEIEELEEALAETED